MIEKVFSFNIYSLEYENLELLTQRKTRYKTIKYVILQYRTQM